jgi:AcrR family transcriptional regulator
METEKTLNGSLREKARSEIHKRINQAATDLLATKSFDEVKMRDVAEAAQISEATLFRHIQGKEDLLMLAFADQIDQVLDSIELKDELDELNTAQTGNSLCVRVLNVYKERSRFYQDHPANSTAYLRLGFINGGLPSKRCIAQGDRTIALVESIISRGQILNLLSAKVPAHLVALNCHAIFIHEIERATVRELSPETFWDRVKPRLKAQLSLLSLD